MSEEVRKAIEHALQKITDERTAITERAYERLLMNNAQLRFIYDEACLSDLPEVLMLKEMVVHLARTNELAMTELLSIKQNAPLAIPPDPR